MGALATGDTFEPLAPSKRYGNLDLIRGVALLGVLLVNLLYFFRVSLFEHVVNFHTHSGQVNHAIDLAVATLLEFKAFNLFSLSFGIGVAVQAERVALRNLNVAAFLFRRFSILLAFGLIHLVFISNVDILSLYAICGLFLIPLLRLPTAVLGVAGLAAIYLPTLPLDGLTRLPSESTWHEHAALATRVYSQGTFAQALSFRWGETREYILPLIAMTAEKTFGLMLIGAALWRGGIIQDPQRYRRSLLLVGFFAGLVGLVNTISDVAARETGQPTAIPPLLQAFGSHVPLAFCYGAWLLAWRNSDNTSRSTFAAAGRMALSNYLAQSIIFASLFYGYGLGLFGKLDPTSASILGLGLYIVQLWFSVWWLNRYRFGPFEWLWRSMTYGRRQPMRQFTAPN